MPYKPMVPCRHPGCPNLVPAGQKYCEEHQALHLEENRSAAARGYNSRWRRENKKFLQPHPLCQERLKRGVATPANGCGPHRTAPRRPPALLGQIELAGALQEVPRQENRTGRLPSGLPLLKSVIQQLFQITFGIQNTSHLHGVADNNIKNGEVSDIDSVIRMWSFLG